MANPFGYAGGYRDSESGLYYLQARYYDPTTQQFLTRNSMLTELPYAYTNGGPLNAGDPSGHDAGTTVVAAGAALAGGGELVGDGVVAALAGAACAAVCVPVIAGALTGLALYLLINEITQLQQQAHNQACSAPDYTGQQTINNVYAKTGTEKSENEITREIKQRQQAGETVDAIIKDLIKDAKKIPDKKERNARLGKINQARKFLGQKHNTTQK